MVCTWKNHDIKRDPLPNKDEEAYLGIYVDQNVVTETKRLKHIANAQLMLQKKRRLKLAGKRQFEKGERLSKRLC